MINQHLANGRGPVLFDESGAKGDRTLHRIPVARKPRFNHYLLHAKRGVEAMEALAILPGIQGNRRSRSVGALLQLHPVQTRPARLTSPAGSWSDRRAGEENLGRPR